MVAGGVPSTTPGGREPSGPPAVTPSTYRPCPVPSTGSRGPGPTRRSRGVALSVADPSLRPSLRTRRSRLRCIMSALPIQNSSMAPKLMIRECSRNRPRIERTTMLSEYPGAWGRSAQMPLTTTSTRTPACDARYSASMTCSSTNALAFSLIRPAASRPNAPSADCGHTPAAAAGRHVLTCGPERPISSLSLRIPRHTPPP